MTINAAWHKRYRMPARPTLHQRIAWHVQHERHCGCRPMPATLRAIIGTRGLRPIARANESHAWLLDKLTGGDRRSIGRSDEVVRDVLRHPELLAALFEGMVDEDPVIRLRAADAAEKVTRRHPDWLQLHKRRLLGDVAAVEQPEVRWHVAQMLPRLDVDPREERKALAILLRYLDDESRIVKTCSMQALAEFALRSPRLKPRVVPMLKTLTATGSAAMRSRGRRLLAAFHGEQGARPGRPGRSTRSRLERVN